MDLKKLGSTLQGYLIGPDHPDYEKERKVFNGMHNKFPKAIVKCSGDQDIKYALSALLDAGERFCVRSGGHSVAGKSTIDDGFVIDLSLNKSVSVDMARQRATSESGATWFDFDREVQRWGLATTGGIVSNTGVSGLTLGGGLGWLMGAHGLACDNLVGASVLLASGETIEASSSENSELLFALRGGGGNFGIVTAMTFELMHLNQVIAGSVFYDLSSLDAAVDRYCEVDAVAPDFLTTDIVIGTGSNGHKYVAVDGCWSGNLIQGRSVWDHVLQKLGGKSYDVGERAYTDWQIHFDDSLRRGRRSYWKSLSLHALSSNVVDALLHFFDVVPSPHTQVSIDTLRGAALSEKNGPSHFSNRSARFVVLINSNWIDPADDETNISWTRDLFDLLSKLTSSSFVYSNYVDRDEANGTDCAYSPKHLESLREVKMMYDPNGVFSSSFLI